MDIAFKSSLPIKRVAKDMKRLQVLLLLAILSSCSSRDEIDLSKVDDREFAEFLMVMDSKCIECHKDYGNTDYKYWIKEGLVVHGDPNKSPIYRSIRGSKSGGIQSMPPLKSAQITEEELSKIKNWILKLDKIQKTDKKLIVSFDPSNKLTSGELLERCYKQFTLTPLPISSEIKKCEDLLKYLSYDQGSIVTTDIRKKVFKTFQLFHSNWANEYNFYTKTENWATFELLDTAQNAYAFTHNLFSSNGRIKDLFQGELNYISKRINKLKSNFLLVKQDGRLYRPEDRYKWVLGNNDEKIRYWSPSPSKVARGELTGVAIQQRNINKIYEVYKDIHEREKHNINTDINAGFGAGVLGSPSYLTLTFGHDNMRMMDGGRHTMRTWSKNVFKDFMCRSLPVLELHDTYKYVNKKSKLSFQQNNTCMNCHATIDPLSGAMRNFSIGFNNIIANKVDLKSDDMGHLQVSIPFDIQRNSHLEKIPSYALKKRSGTLRYRNFRGELIERGFSNPDELGKEMMKQVDPYICFSKRYLEYFTGVKIDLDTLIKNRNFHTAQERFYYELLLELGLDLQKSQNLEGLVKNIISHPIYSQRDFKARVKYED